MSIPPLPIGYRADLLDKIYKHLQAGKCGALYGIASSGKSRLVEFMGRPDVRERYLGQNWTKTLFPWVDGNDLLEHTEWGLYEKILNAIIADLMQLPDRGGADRARVEEWYWQLVRTENRSLARRYAAFAIENLAEYRVVLLLDDIEGFLATASDLVFSGLRGLRDRFKRDNQYRLLYLLISRRQLTALRDEEDSAAFESFLELFKNFSHPIGCYNHDDALFMVRRLADAYQLPGRAFTNEVAEQLIEVTGGHAGLIDAAFHSGTETEWTRLGLARALITAGGVFNECVSIYESLTADHRATLIDVATGGDPGTVATRFLEDAGLVRRGPSRLPQTMELLRLSLTEQDQLGPRIQLQPDRHAIQVDAYTVVLTEREFLIVQHLYQRRGHDFNYFELHEALTTAAPFDRAARDEIRKLLRRIDNKIYSSSGRHILIHTADRSCQLIGVEGH